MCLASAATSLMSPCFFRLCESVGQCVTHHTKFHGYEDCILYKSAWMMDILMLISCGVQRVQMYGLDSHSTKVVTNAVYEPTPRGCFGTTHHFPRTPRLFLGYLAALLRWHVKTYGAVYVSGRVEDSFGIPSPTTQHEGG